MSVSAAQVDAHLKNVILQFAASCNAPLTSAQQMVLDSIKKLDPLLQEAAAKTRSAPADVGVWSELLRNSSREYCH